MSRVPETTYPGWTPELPAGGSGFASEVVNQAARLLLSVGQARGAAVVDLDTDFVWMLEDGGDPAVAGDWKLIGRRSIRFLGSVASQAAMLALFNARAGDWVHRSDLGRRYDFTGTDPATLAHWTQALPATVSTGDLATEPGAGSAAAGKLGEYVASLVPMGVGATALVNATPANITSIPLTAGNWDVEANVIFFGIGTTPVSRGASISLTSANIHEDGLQGYNSSPADGVESIALTRKRISLAAPATVYLVAQAYFAGGSMDGAGGITARRVH